MAHRVARPVVGVQPGSTRPARPPLARSMGAGRCGCPTMIADGQLVATHGFGSIDIRTIEGDAVPNLPFSRFDITGSNLERWSPDLRSMASASQDTGAVTVWHLPRNGTPTSESYHLNMPLPWTGNVELSWDGSRLATVTTRPAREDVRTMCSGT